MMFLNKSKENQRLLSVRRKRLLMRQTKEEIHVGILLSNIGEKFIPQKGFFSEKSHYIVDFYLPKRRKTCLEIDGAFHKSQKEYDLERDMFLCEQRGFRVIRISNEDAINMDESALIKILERDPES